MNNNQTTLSNLKLTVDNFLRERDWHQFHSPKVDSMGLVVEAGELLELFLFSQPHDGGQRVLLEKRESVEDELADCFFWVLCFANTASVDLAKALHRKFSTNENKDDAHTPLFDLIQLIVQQSSGYKTATDQALALSCKASFFMNVFLEEAQDGTGYALLKEKRPEIEMLLVQVLVAIVQFAEMTSIDILGAFARKVKKNAKKYPIEKSKGKSTKYTDL